LVLKILVHDEASFSVTANVFFHASPKPPPHLVRSPWGDLLNFISIVLFPLYFPKNAVSNFVYSITEWGRAVA